jgi:outer membrane protein assembly factor BamB
MMFIKVRPSLRRPMLAVGIATLVALIASTSAQATIYGVQPLTGKIVIVDPATGLTSPLASPAGLDGADTRIGLSGAEGGAVLIYSNDDDGTDADLQRYSPITGALLSSASTGIWPTDGLTYQSGIIFSSHINADVHKQVGYGGSESFFATSTPSPPVGGLAGDDNGRSWESDSDGQIREFNATTGAILNTFLAPSAATQGLAYDGTFLYASNAAGRLFTLNANNGSVLNNVAVTGGPLYGLGSANGVPEPATLGLLAMAGMATISFARRRSHG